MYQENFQSNKAEIKFLIWSYKDKRDESEIHLKFD